LQGNELSEGEKLGEECNVGIWTSKIIHLGIGPCKIHRGTLIMEGGFIFFLLIFPENVVLRGTPCGFYGHY